MFNTIDSIIERDPAAHSRIQVLLTYPGIQALWRYRVAHFFWKKRLFLLAEWYAKRTRRKTGVEIHPAATIGKRLFIDHGMGVVIGSSAIIGDDVTLLHGVTLGSRKDKSEKRHPTIGNNVFIGANAQILGNITLGDDSKIGAGAIVLADIPAGKTAVGNPARII